MTFYFTVEFSGAPGLRPHKWDWELDEQREGIGPLAREFRLPIAVDRSHRGDIPDELQGVRNSTKTAVPRGAESVQ